MGETNRLASVNEIRVHFPALERMHAGRPVAYFDGPGGTQVPRQVIEAVTEYLVRHNANTHWDYATSRETDAMLDGARQAFADLVGGEPGEIAFGANMTSLTFHVARALGRTFAAGDRIVTTELDHHANIAPWRALVEERGVEIRTVRMDPERGDLDYDDLERALRERKPRLLALGAASNALGTMPDVSRAARLAREAGALVYVDAVHLAAHARIDVTALGADFLCFSPYKLYGPHVGVLWGRHELLASLPVAKLDPSPDEAPERIELGTLNHEGIAGAAAAVDFLASLAPGASRRARLDAVFAELHERGRAQATQLWEGLGEIQGVRRYGPSPKAPRTPTVAFTIEGISPAGVARRLDQQGIFVSHGDFYAQTVIERLGLAPDGLVRAGCACYTTEEEIGRLIDAVRECVSA